MSEKNHVLIVTEEQRIRLMRLVNDAILQIQNARLERGESIQPEVMKPLHPSLFSLFDMLAYTPTIEEELSRLGVQFTTFDYAAGEPRGITMNEAFAEIQDTQHTADTPRP